MCFSDYPTLHSEGVSCDVMKLGPTILSDSGSGGLQLTEQKKCWPNNQLPTEQGKQVFSFHSKLDKLIISKLSGAQ